MLANALVSVALIALCAATILSAGLLNARIGVHRLAERFAGQTYERALVALETTVANYEQTGAFPSPLPRPATLAPECMDGTGSCRFTGVATISLLRVDTNATSAPCASEAPACVFNEEANAWVNERRVSARVSGEVRASDGTVLAARSRDVILRTMIAPPYVAIAGARDGTFDDVADANLPGDDGGAQPTNVNPCDFSASGSSAGTVVRVVYQNVQTGACRDGSSWRTSSY